MLLRSSRSRPNAIRLLAPLPARCAPPTRRTANAATSRGLIRSSLRGQRDRGCGGRAGGGASGSRKRYDSWSVLSCACLTPRGSTESALRAGLSRELWIVRDSFVWVSGTVTQLCNAARRMGRSCAMRGNGRFVYDFDEPSGGGRELLGCKGRGLAEMTQLGIPVPAGFTVTTDACREYMRNGKM